MQRGLLDGAIAPETASLVGGRVVDLDGAPVEGVRVTVLGHIEYGETWTRPDGRFDMAVAGNQDYTLEFAREEFSQNFARVKAVRRDYSPRVEVVLAPLDGVTFSTGSGPWGVDPLLHEASVVSDVDGTRRTRLLLPPQALPTDATFRVTETTVGALGGDTVPPMQGYTPVYSADFRVDELDGPQPTFFWPVLPFYVDNYLGYPVGGSLMQAQFDDRDLRWVPYSKNARVIRVVGIANGVADVDVDGDGIGESLPELEALGFVQGEVKTLATFASVGDEFMRGEAPHFSSWSFLLPFVPEGAIENMQEVAAPFSGLPTDDECVVGDPAVECENRILREAFSIPGTDLHLAYSSARQPGWFDASRVTVPLLGHVVPDGLQKVEYHMDVRGARHKGEAGPLAGAFGTLFWPFLDRDDWDESQFEATGVDAPVEQLTHFDGWGREVRGAANAHVEIEYVYGGNAKMPLGDGWRDALACLPPNAEQITVAARSYSDFKIRRRFDLPVGRADAADHKLGGWTLSEHHTYDMDAGVLFRGDGTRKIVGSPRRRSGYVGALDFAVTPDDDDKESDREEDEPRDAGAPMQAVFAGEGDFAVDVVQSPFPTSTPFCKGYGANQECRATVAGAELANASRPFVMPDGQIMLQSGTAVVRIEDDGNTRVASDTDQANVFIGSPAGAPYYEWDCDNHRYLWNTVGSRWPSQDEVAWPDPEFVPPDFTGWSTDGLVELSDMIGLPSGEVVWAQHHTLCRAVKTMPSETHPNLFHWWGKRDWAGWSLPVPGTPDLVETGQLNTPKWLQVAPTVDGALLAANETQIRRYFMTNAADCKVAGDGSTSPAWGEEISPDDLRISKPLAMETDEDGVIYVVNDEHRLLRIVEGKSVTVAAGSNRLIDQAESPDDLGPLLNGTSASQTWLTRSMKIGPDGLIYWTARARVDDGQGGTKWSPWQFLRLYKGRVEVIVEGPDPEIELPVAPWQGRFSDLNTFDFRRAEIGEWFDFTTDGTALLIQVGRGGYVARIPVNGKRSPPPGGVVRIDDAERDVYYEFDYWGRHLRTADLDTRESVYEFDYDPLCSAWAAPEPPDEEEEEEEEPPQETGLPPGPEEEVDPWTPPPSVLQCVRDRFKQPVKITRTEGDFTITAPRNQQLVGVLGAKGYTSELRSSDGTATLYDANEGKYGRLRKITEGTRERLIEYDGWGRVYYTRGPDTSADGTPATKMWALPLSVVDEGPDSEEGPPTPEDPEYYEPIPGQTRGAAFSFGLASRQTHQVWQDPDGNVRRRTTGMDGVAVTSVTEPSGDSTTLLPNGREIRTELTTRYRSGSELPRLESITERVDPSLLPISTGQVTQTVRFTEAAAGGKITTGTEANGEATGPKRVCEYASDFIDCAVIAGARSLSKVAKTAAGGIAIGAFLLKSIAISGLDAGAQYDAVKRVASGSTYAMQVAPLEGDGSEDVETLSLSIDHTHDGLGRRTRTDVKDHSFAEESSVSFTYKGSTTAIETVYDPNDVVNTRVTFGYDEDLSLRTVTVPEGGIWRLDRDAAGRVTTMVPPLGEGQIEADVEIQHTYNFLGLPEAVLFPSGRAISYGYDSLTGRVESVFDSRGTTSLEYDAATGTLAESIDAKGGILRFNRTGGFLLDVDYSVQESTVDQGGATQTYLRHTNVAYEYDDDWVADKETVAVDSSYLGTISSSYRPDGTLLTRGSAFYRRADPAVPIIDQVGVEDVVTKFDRFPDGAIRRVRHLFGPGETVLFEQRVLLRDSTGRVRRVREQTFGLPEVEFRYTYNDAGHLKEVREGPFPSVGEDPDHPVRWAYEYDHNGNRTSLRMEEPLPNSPFGTGYLCIEELPCEHLSEYDEADRHESTLEVTSGTTTGEDGVIIIGAGGFERFVQVGVDGELQATWGLGSPQSSRTYDAVGRVISAVVNGETITYEVDGAGRQTLKSVDGVPVRRFVYGAGSSPVAMVTWDGSGNEVVSRFVYGELQQSPTYMKRGGGTYRLIHDRLGTVRAVVDADTGEVVERRDYDPWGVRIGGTPAMQPFGFAGGIEEPELGLVRFGARDYSPRDGRWAMRDPSWFQGGVTNLYVYADNDPVNKVDPSGRVPVLAVVIGAGFAAHTLYESVSAFLDGDYETAALNVAAAPLMAMGGAVVSGGAKSLGAGVKMAMRAARGPLAKVLRGSRRAPAGKIETITRRMSHAEANAVREAGGLVPKPGSRGAKWVTQGSVGQGSLVRKGHEVTVTFRVRHGTTRELKRLSKSFDDVPGEASLPGGVLTKSNEPGALGVGVDLLEWFNDRVVDIVIK